MTKGKTQPSCKEEKAQHPSSQSGAHVKTCTNKFDYHSPCNPVHFHWKLLMSCDGTSYATAAISPTRHYKLNHCRAVIKGCKFWTHTENLISTFTQRSGIPQRHSSHPYSHICYPNHLGNSCNYQTCYILAIAK